MAKMAEQKTFCSISHPAWSLVLRNLGTYAWILCRMSIRVRFFKNSFFFFISNSKKPLWLLTGKTRGWYYKPESILCYGLNMKCPSQTHVFDTWSPARGTVLADCESYRREDLGSRSRMLGVNPACYFQPRFWSRMCLSIRHIYNQ